MLLSSQDPFWAHHRLWRPWVATERLHWCTRADRQCLRSFNSPGGEPAWGNWDARILCLGQEILLWEGQNHRDGDGYAKAFFCYTASQGASDPPPWRSLFTIIIRNSAPENNPSVKIPLFL